MAKTFPSGTLINKLYADDFNESFPGWLDSLTQDELRQVRTKYTAIIGEAIVSETLIGGATFYLRENSYALESVHMHVDLDIEYLCGVGLCALQMIERRVQE